MNDAVAMALEQGHANLAEHLLSPSDIGGALGLIEGGATHLLEGLALDEFHGEEGLRFVAAIIEDAHHVGVSDAR